MYQADRTRPLWTRIYMLGILTRRVARLSDSCQFAVTQIRSRRGGRGCRGLVAVDAPDQFRTLCRSPRKKRRERHFPEAFRPGLANASPKRFEVYQNPRRWCRGNVEVLPIPMLPVFNWGAALLKRPAAQGAATGLCLFQSMPAFSPAFPMRVV